MWIRSGITRMCRYLAGPVHTTIGCGKQGFPSAQPYLSHQDLLNQLFDMPFPLKQRQNITSLGVNNWCESGRLNR
ncbi:hypothetical protein N7527_000106 [Penicillium freii]|nr:hypothetical protein N7527_000106 [Penicillium freii]